MMLDGTQSVPATINPPHTEYADQPVEKGGQARRDTPISRSFLDVAGSQSPFSTCAGARSKRHPNDAERRGARSHGDRGNEKRGFPVSESGKAARKMC